MANEKITIADIANTLGISTVSVSRALAGQPGIGEELRTAIIQKAKELGYHKNKKNTPVNILVLHRRPYMIDNSNSGLMLQGIEKALQNAGLDYHMEFVDPSFQTKLELPYKLAKGTKFDGVIFIGRFTTAYLTFIRALIPKGVCFTGYSPSFDGDTVRFNFNHAGYQQCEFLIRKGHTQIGFFGDFTLFRNQERRFGIQNALDDYGIRANPDHFLDLNDEYHNRLTKLVSDGQLPSAVICDHDYTAIELIKLLHPFQIRVPDDLSLLGCGNTEISQLAIPALSTLDLNIEFACAEAVATLLQRIGYPEQPFRTTGILCRMVERDSVIPRK